MNLGQMSGMGKLIDMVTGEPVHATTGAKILQDESDLDFVLPSRLPLVWQRNYNSLDLREGLFGQGFSVPVEVGLKLNRLDDDHPHCFINEQGREIPFPNVVPGESHLNASEGYRLACLFNHHYVVESNDGYCFDFGPALTHGTQILLLQRIEDRNGNWIVLHRAEDGKLLTIGDCAQRLYRIDYHPQHANRVAEVVLVQADKSLAETRSLPRTLARYGYDHRGRLSSVRNALDKEVRQFTWHDDGPGKGLIASHTLPDGLTCHYRWERFADHPRVVEHWTDDGQRWISRYTLPKVTQRGHTEVTDHLGRIKRWEWDGRYAPLVYESAAAARTTLEWDAAGQLVAVRQPHGACWTFAYDERGNMVHRRDPLGQVLRLQWRTDIPLLAQSTADERSWRYGYDHRGNLFRMIDPAGGETLFGHDEHGQVITHTNAKGGTSHQAWNAAGQLLAYTDCSKRTTQYDYGEYSQLTRVRDAAGRVQTVHSDALGQVTGIIAADGGIWRSQWSRAGQLQRLTNALGGSTIYCRDSRGRLTEHIDALGHITGYRYDQAGNLAELTTPNRESYGFHYNTADQLIAQIGLDGRATRYSLDAQGLPIGIEQAANTQESVQTELGRDLLGRLIVKRSAETSTFYRYSQERLADVIRHRRNADGTDGALLDRITLEWDALGNLTKETSEWHPSLLEQVGVRTGEPVVHVLAHQYDPLGNRIETVLPDGESVSMLYYGSGHLHRLSLDSEAGEQVVADFERDALHREIWRSQGAIGTYTGYAASGQIDRMRASPEGAGSQDVLNRSWDYSLNGECVFRRSRQTGQQTYSYDALGRVTGSRQMALADGMGQLHKPLLSLPDERFLWDDAGNPWDGKPLHANRVTGLQALQQTHDLLGRLMRRAKSEYGKDCSKQSFTWNASGELAAVRTRENGRESLSRYAYDALGRRIAVHDGHNDGVTLTVWQGMQVVQQRRLGDCGLSHTTGQHVATFVYQPGSYAPVARVETFAGVLGELVRDQHQRLAGRPFRPVVYHFHTSPNGTPEAMTNETGRLVWQGYAKTWGGLTYEAVDEVEVRERVWSGIPEPFPQDMRMPGQWHDRATGLHYNTFRYYDPEIGRFISEDPIGLLGGVNLYAYAPNPLRWIDPLGLTVQWVDPTTINFSQRTVTSNNYAELMRTGQWDWNQSPLNVMDVDGQLVTYDNRRLDAALEAGQEKVPINIVDPDSVHPDSTTGKTWREKFQQRFNDRRNVRAGGAVPEKGVSTRPSHC